MEDPPCSIGNTSSKGPFSIAMSVREGRFFVAKIGALLPLPTLMVIVRVTNLDRKALVFFFRRFCKQNRGD